MAKIALPSAAAVLLATLVTATAAAGASSFDGKVCGLVTARQVAAVGVTSRCTNARPMKGLGATTFRANWAGKSTSAPQLQVTVARYSDAGALQLARRNLMQGLPGTPRRAKGIGSAAYEASGPSAIGIHIAVAKYIVYITLATTSTHSRASASLEAIGKRIAARL